MLQINAKRLESRLKELSTIGRSQEGGGWTRPSFTPQYHEARDLVASWMRKAGMQVRVDAVGNLIGRLEGTDPKAATVAMGSHIDTVKNGGMFDGAAGTMSALEVATTISEAGLAHRYPIEVIAFAEEEGARFGEGLMGSKTMAGGYPDPEAFFAKKALNGHTIGEIFREYGFEPERMHEAIAPKGYYKCYFELHIEQSHVLDSTGDVLGVVDGIASLVWLRGHVKGRAAHAGATPMAFRKDALIPVAMIAKDAEDIAKSVSDNTVATLGKLEVSPNVTNIIPGDVVFTFDVRGLHMEDVEKVAELISKRFKQICREREIEGEIEQTIYLLGAEVKDEMKALVENAVKAVGVPYRHIVSGAGHDAQMMARITDIGMIFVPSINGASHVPEEDTKFCDIAAGAQALLNAALKKIA